MCPAAARSRPNPVWRLVVVVMLGLALAGPVIIVRDQLAAREPAPPAAAAGGTTVTMAGVAFAPAALTVARGTTVTFDNDDTAPHTVTARLVAVDSGVLDPGRTFRLTVVDGFDYRCSIHPSMTAKIVVTG
ncbi:MAG TPA: cupredoxin domain-containing protein [Actinomycetes bacterium]|jgi:plastocyanin|nr:cupredoxin domain-containing protein [Actinomycetes bacterium]